MELFVIWMVASTPQDLGNDGRGDPIVLTPDPHRFVGRLKIWNEFEHHVLSSCGRWMAGQDMDIVALDCLLHHLVMHLVLWEALLPTKPLFIDFCKSFEV